MKLFIMVFLMLLSPYVAGNERIKQKLVFGVFPYVSVNQILKTYVPLKYYLEKKLDADVVIVSAKNYRAFVSRTSQKQYDFILTAPHFALKAEREASYVRLIGFADRLQAEIVVAENSPVKVLSDLKGMTIGTPDSLAIVSLLGEGLLKDGGLKIGEDVFFQSTLSHRNVLLSVLKNKREAGLVSSTVARKFIAKTNAGFRTLQSSQQIPSAMFMMNTALAEKFKLELKAAMKDFQVSEYGQQFFRSMPVGGFREISDSDMKTLSAYTDRLEEML